MKWNKAAWPPEFCWQIKSYSAANTFQRKQKDGRNELMSGAKILEVRPRIKGGFALALRTSVSFLSGTGNCSGPGLLSTSHFPCWNQCVCSWYPCLSHSVFWGQVMYVFDFTGPQIERNCSQEFWWVDYPSTLDLDETFILDFWADEI